MGALHRRGYRQARDALLDAVRIDSAFAQAYGKLAEVSLLAFSVLDPDHPAYGYAERAAALSNRLPPRAARSEEHTSELQSQSNLVCRLLLEKKKQTKEHRHVHIAQ